MNATRQASTERRRTVVTKVRNLYKVPLKTWRKWSETARTVFNRTYDFTYNNQLLITHPKAEKVKPQHWKTTAWNAAWIAADAVDDALPEVVEDVDTKTGATVKSRRVKTSIQGEPVAK